MLKEKMHKRNTWQYVLQQVYVLMAGSNSKAAECRFQWKDH